MPVGEERLFLGDLHRVLGLDLQAAGGLGEPAQESIAGAVGLGKRAVFLVVGDGFVGGCGRSASVVQVIGNGVGVGFPMGVDHPDVRGGNGVALFYPHAAVLLGGEPALEGVARASGVRQLGIFAVYRGHGLGLAVRQSAAVRV